MKKTSCRTKHLCNNWFLRHLSWLFSFNGVTCSYWEKKKGRSISVLKISKISSKLIDNPGEELSWCNFANNSSPGRQPALGLMFKNSLNFMGKGGRVPLIRLILLFPLMAPPVMLYNFSAPQGCAFKPVIIAPSF